MGARFLFLASLLGLASPSPELRLPQDSPRSLTAEEAQLVQGLREQGVRLDPARKLCSIQVEVQVRDDLLEYLLVGSGGAGHESAFLTTVQPSVLNVALLALGVEPGKNASWSVKDPPPSEEELRDGVSPYEVRPPSGDALYLYVAWREGEDVYLYRVEDLVRNLATGRSMRRHAWVYLGSRMLPASDGSGEQFAADLYQNLINIAFFSDGFTLLTGALGECVEQTIWMANAWLVPERGSRVELIFSREKLESLAPEHAAELPVVAAASSTREVQDER